jgi:hypothetical protein
MGHTILASKLPTNLYVGCDAAEEARAWVEGEEDQARAQALRTKVRNVIRDLHRKTCSLRKLQCHLPPSLGRDRNVTDRQQGHQQQGSS